MPATTNPGEHEETPLEDIVTTKNEEQALPASRTLKAPSLLADVRRSFTGKTWAVTLLSPVVAVAIAFLFSLVTVAGGGNFFLNLSVSNMNIDAQSLPLVTSALLVTALGMGGRWNVTITAPQASESSVSVIYSSLFLPALTITAIIGLTLYLCHLLVGRGSRNSTLMVWIPAWISALILSGLGIFISVITNATLSVPTRMGDASMLIKPNWWITALLILPVGLFCSAFGRLSTVKNSPETRFTLTSMSFIPTFAHAVRIAFAVYLVAIFVFGVYAIPGLLQYFEGLPQLSFWSLLPFVISGGAIILEAFLGGIGYAKLSSTLAPTQMDSTLLLKHVVPWLIVVGISLIFLLLLAAAYRWGRTRDPRLEYGPVAWIAMPFAFTSILAIINVIARAQRVNVVEKASESYSYGISWYVIPAGIILGLIVEALSRIFRTKPPVLETSGYSVPHASEIPGKPDVPGAPGGLALHPGNPSEDIEENSEDVGVEAPEGPEEEALVEEIEEAEETAENAEK